MGNALKMIIVVTMTLGEMNIYVKRRKFVGDKMRKLAIVAVLAIICLIAAPAIGAADAKGYGEQDGSCDGDGNQYQEQPDSPHGDQDGSDDGDQHQGPPQ
jgi:hypothetical protein